MLLPSSKLQKVFADLVFINGNDSLNGVGALAKNKEAVLGAWEVSGIQ